MTIERISQVIGEIEGKKIPFSLRPPLREMILGTTCMGSKFHSPTPLLVRPVHLSDVVTMVASDGPWTLLNEDLVHLCATCEDNLAVYLTIRLAYDGDTPQRVRRDFGNTIRALGDRAWAYHLKRSVLTPV
jgi:hypothetical protein